jgi:flagellar motor protein MotB
MPARVWLAAAGLIASSLYAAAVGAVAREDLLFLSDDGQAYTLFTTLRSGLPARELYVPQAQPDEAPYLFFYPPEPRARSLETGRILQFNGGDYALLGSRQFESHEITRQNDGSYRFRSWDGLTLGNGHFGKWNAPDPFEQFTYAWVIPSTIDILEYSSNRSGQWTREDNALVWTGRNVNDITFDIRFRVRPPRTITVTAEPVRGVRRDNAAAGERITLDTALLFSSGSHALTDQGRTTLQNLAAQLQNQPIESIVVEGHTDNQPLKPYLQEIYPSNWELSAMRATHVVRVLAEAGIDAARLEARAYGEQHPVADNKTEEGRAKNRRIELLVTRQTPAQSAEQSVAEKNLPATETPGAGQGGE